MDETQENPSSTTSICQSFDINRGLMHRPLLNSKQVREREGSKMEIRAECSSRHLRLESRREQEFKSDSELPKLVGRDSREKKLLSLLDISSENAPIMIGIWGPLGIGKSAIAMFIYNMIYGQYDACCYLEKVRKHSKERGLVALQQELVKSLKPEIIIQNLLHGTEMIRQHGGNKKCLIVLDDVDQKHQLDNLTGGVNWFGVGSRIIITTRDATLLRQEEKEIYPCEGLNWDEAMELLCLTAFKQKQPLEGSERMCNRILEYASGNPLALIKFGGFLADRILEEGESSLDAIITIVNHAMLDEFCISFDPLSEELKSMFLDIACFFNGKKEERVLEILDCCGLYSKIRLSILINISFVTISNSIICMPEWVQQMGWEIVRKKYTYDPGKWSRLHRHEDINEVMSKNLGTEEVEAVVLDQHGLECNWNSTAFVGLCNLRLLLICCKVHLCGGLEYLPDKELTFLKWKDYPLDYFPPNFYPSNLVELNMCHSRIKQFWGGEKIFDKLKTIKLRHSQNLIKTPSFTGIPNLEILDLEGCRKLVEVDPSIGILKKLRMLNLKDCSSLGSPPHIISKDSLEIFILSGCSGLDKFPYFEGKMRKLSQLYLDGTGHKNVPKSIILKYFGWLPPINKRKLNNLASLLAKVPNITKLYLRNCDLPEGALPSDLGYLSSLEVLDLSRNKFISLPASIGHLPKLQFLGLAGCNLLQSLRELPSNIEYVEARDCSSLVTLSNAFKLRTCKDLVLSFINCFKLKKNHDHRGIVITSLKSYLQSLLRIQNQELSHLNGCFDVVIPGTEVPELFRRRKNGHSVRLDLRPEFRNSNWIAFLFCAVFCIHGHVIDDENGNLELENSQTITCQLYTNEGPIGTGFGFTVSRGTLVESSHLWVRCIANGDFEEIMAIWNRIHYIEASFSTESHCLNVVKCGFHVLYKQEVEETRKRKLQRDMEPEDLSLTFFSYDTKSL